MFLNKYPPLAGYTLIAPGDHREQVTRDFTLEEYLQLQQLIYQVAEAIRQVVPTERLYILTLGSITTVLNSSFTREWAGGGQAFAARRSVIHPFIAFEANNTFAICSSSSQDYIMSRAGLHQAASPT